MFYIIYFKFLFISKHFNFSTKNSLKNLNPQIVTLHQALTILRSVSYSIVKINNYLS